MCVHLVGLDAFWRRALLFTFQVSRHWTQVSRQPTYLYAYIAFLALVLPPRPTCNQRPAIITSEASNFQSLANYWLFFHFVNKSAAAAHAYAHMNKHVCAIASHFSLKFPPTFLPSLAMCLRGKLPVGCRHCSLYVCAPASVRSCEREQIFRTCCRTVHGHVRRCRCKQEWQEGACDITYERVSN